MHLRLMPCEEAKHTETARQEGTHEPQLYQHTGRSDLHEEIVKPQEPFAAPILHYC